LEESFDVQIMSDVSAKLRPLVMHAQQLIAFFARR
jgi:hypothetical protein